MPKKKILFVITKGVWGGAQKYVFDLALALQNSHDVAVIYGTEGLLSQKLKEKNIRTIRVESLGRDINPLLDISSFFELLKIFRKERPDIVHLNSSKIGGLGACAGRLTGVKKIIFTAHGWAFNEDRDWLSKSIIWFLSWLTALFAHIIIVLGEKEKHQTLHMPLIAKEKVRLIRLGITTPEYLEKYQARRELAKFIQKPENFFDSKILVGTIAELVPNKGIEYALEAFSDISNKNIVYIEIGTGDLAENLQKKIIEHNLEETVFLTGFINTASKYLPGFDVFLLPSLKEGLPYTILEAGIASLPVVATRVGAIPEIIQNHHSGLLIEPKNSKEITDAVMFLSTHPDIGTQYGKKLYTTVSQEFNIKHMAEKTLAVYNENINK